MMDIVKEAIRKILVLIFDFAEVKVVDFKGKPKLKSLKNELVQELDRSYYKRNKKSFDNPFDYTGYVTGNNYRIPLKDFLCYEKNIGYLQNCKAWGQKVKNETFNELNQYYPKVYEKIIELFNREGFDLKELEQAFK